MIAGAGRAVIKYPAGVWPLDGFVGVHDELCARALFLEVGCQQVIWLVLDQTSLAPEPLSDIAAVAAETTGVARDRVVVSVSHTFSAPHLGDDPMARQAVLQAVRNATTEAVASASLAVLGVGSGAVDINVNRDIATPDGWMLGADPAGFSDKTLKVVALDAVDGGPIARLVNYAVQPSVMHESPDHLATADLAGVAVRHIENATGAVALFLVGAAGDQAPVSSSAEPGSLAAQRNDGDSTENGYDRMQTLGERLGQAVLNLAVTTSDATVIGLTEAMMRVPGQVPTDRHQIRPTPVPAYIAGDSRDLPWWILILDDIAIVGVQVELSAITGQAICEASPFAHTLVVTMVNGAAKYLPDAPAFDRGTYEAQSSRYAKGAAEALTQEITRCLKTQWERG